jgi:hypothetical protein
MALESFKVFVAGNAFPLVVFGLTACMLMLMSLADRLVERRYVNGDVQRGHRVQRVKITIAAVLLGFSMICIAVRDVLA